MSRVIRFVFRGLVAAPLVLAVCWWAARPVQPDAFYAAPGSLPPRPGVLLRQESLGQNLPADAQAWRILYTTTTEGSVPAVASAVVMTARNPPPGPRPVIAWTHGTTGVVPGCAPSLLGDPFANVPALAQLIGHGWILVATDYVGQGTQGPHPYLIGEGQARSALDSVRAARQIAGLHTGNSTVVWGHSQGGNAALWTGIIAPTYAPDVPIAGVAAFAPASDLRALVDQVHRTVIGRIMASFLLRAYSETYPDVQFKTYAGGWRQIVAWDIAGRCLERPKALFSVAEALIAAGGIFSISPTSGPLGERLAQNTPDRRLPQPVLIAQGMADDLVLPGIQSRFVSRWCSEGQTIEFLRYRGLDHLSVVAPDSPLTPDLIQWTQDRLAGVPPAAGCHEDSRG